MLRTLSLSLLSAAALAAPASAQTYLAQNGLVVIELEESGAPGPWTESSSTPGYTGESYIRWDGPNLFNSPGQSGIFSFDFEIADADQWLLRLRNRHENSDPTEENDVWIRMDGGVWFKTFSNQNGSVGAWTWETRFDIAHGNQPQASWPLSPGIHTIEFSGRSNGFKMDRFHLHRPGAAGATDPNQPVSPQRFGQEYGISVPNSTGQRGTIEATGSPKVAENSVILTSLNLPPGMHGYFIGSRQIGFTANPAGSEGNLLLDGQISRFTGLVDLVNPDGSAAVRIDLTQVRIPTGMTSILAGESWAFQFWHRDLTSSGGPTSNFSSGLSVVFE